MSSDRVSLDPGGAGTPTGADPCLVKDFPRPPQEVRAAIERLQLAATSPSTDDEELRKMAALPRPWDPATCHGRLRIQLWSWLDDVADWINTEHLWALHTPGLPTCWPAHPHLVHDLAVVASIRYLAGHAITPAALEEWHRHALPAFLNRLSDRLGDGCLADHPAVRPRHARDLEFAQVRATRRSERPRLGASTTAQTDRMLCSGG
jgi:hypothetical protein